MEEKKQTDVNEIAPLFTHCESILEEIQRDKLEVMTAPINQLRYAFKHFLDWHKKSNAENLDACKRHCQRAIYDAYDARILFYLEQIKDFIEEYKLRDVTQVDSNYLDMQQRVEEIKNDVTRWRNDCNGDRAEYYTKMKDYSAELQSFCHRLPGLRNALNKSAAWTIVKYVVGALGTLAVFLLGQYTKSCSDENPPSKDATTKVAPKTK